MAIWIGDFAHVDDIDPLSPGTALNTPRALATATIDGDRVILSAPTVAEPAKVRYAWADNPACNLYNGAGLPASPFRTDDWQ